MKLLIFALLIAVSIQQDQILGSSGDSSATVISNDQGKSSQLPQPSTASFISSGSRPSSLSMSSSFSGATQPSNWNFINQNSLGSSTKWLTPSGDGRIYSLGWLTTYSITFTTDCPQNGVTLKFAATGSSFVYLNGHQLLSWGLPWPTIHTVSLSKPELICGCNTIKILVYNFFYPSPAALIYVLNQNTTNCYNCQNLGVSYYNRQTCSCECALKYQCSQGNQLMVWEAYPACGCKCKKTDICRSNQYWNLKTCNCQCKKVCCPQGKIQDPNTCLCVSSECLPFAPCGPNQYWDSKLCQCVGYCLPFAPCPSNKKWSFTSCKCECIISACPLGKILNQSSCSCQCPTAVTLCPLAQRYNPSSCACQCPIVLPCNVVARWNPQSCSCECLALPYCTPGYTINYQTCSCVLQTYTVQP